mgnify:CR=1 FL=1
MRGVYATLIAFIVLYTLFHVYPSLKTNMYTLLKRERNHATIATWIMLKATCENVDYYLQLVNATQPLPNTPTGTILVWCNDTPIVRGFTWSP